MIFPKKMNGDIQGDRKRGLGSRQKAGMSEQGRAEELHDGEISERLADSPYPHMTTKERLHNLLRNPVADKVLGMIAVSPQIYILYGFTQQVLGGRFDIFHGAIAANMLISVTTMLIRRTAVRISLNPLFWLITAVRSYWLFVVTTYVYVLTPINIWQAHVANTLFYIGIAIIIGSRLSLGRNIGFLPARRELVTTGMYGLVRHPIHTGEVVFFISFMMRSPTALNIGLMVLGIVFVLWKSLIEEKFLKNDADYREYCQCVRYRWIPGVV